MDEKKMGTNHPTACLPPWRKGIANPCCALRRPVEMSIQLLLYMVPISPPRFLWEATALGSKPLVGGTGKPAALVSHCL